jgi:hypothetical protein
MTPAHVPSRRSTLSLVAEFYRARPGSPPASCWRIARQLHRPLAEVHAALVDAARIGLVRLDGGQWRAA